jgi:hypothetical protein
LELIKIITLNFTVSDFIIPPCSICNKKIPHSQNKKPISFLLAVEGGILSQAKLN